MSLASASLISAFTAESACKLHISLLPFVTQLMETAGLRVMQSAGFSRQSQLGAYMLTNNKGFTLIELTFVVAVIGVLAAVAIPNFIAYRDKAYLCEGYALSDPVRKEVVEYYDHVGAFPPDNAALGLPEAMRGKYVGSIKVKDGAVEIKYRDDSRQKGVTVTLRPVVSSDDPTGPVTWEEQIAKAN